MEMHSDTWARIERPRSCSRKTENIARRQLHNDGGLSLGRGAKGCDVDGECQCRETCDWIRGRREALWFPTLRDLAADASLQ